MKIIFFSSNINIINEWQTRHEIESSIECYDIDSLKQALKKNKSYILIADYDSVAHDINELIAANTLPNNVIVMERAPEIITGKMLISHHVKAYGNSRMLSNHFKQMIETVENKKIWTYPELTVALTQEANQASLSEDAQKLIENKLTAKELEVVYLILDGLTNDAIASSLNITTRTVKAHVSSIFSKLHTNDRVSLILLLK